MWYRVGCFKWFWLGRAVPYLCIRAQASSQRVRYLEILWGLKTVLLVHTPLITLCDSTAAGYSVRFPICYGHRAGPRNTWSDYSVSLTSICSLVHNITDYTIFRTNIEREMRCFKIVSSRTTSCIVHCQALCYLASRPQNCQLYYASNKKAAAYCLLRLLPDFSRVYVLAVFRRITINTISRRLRERFTKYDIPTLRCK